MRAVNNGSRAGDAEVGAKTDGEPMAGAREPAAPAGVPPMRVTPFYRSLAKTEDPLLDPIAAQFVPQEREKVVLPCESDDPLDDRRYQVLPRVIHHYRDRILVLATDECAVFCRHCFRRHFTAAIAADAGSSAANRHASHYSGAISNEEIAAAAAYLAEHTEVSEAIISGGDPLMLAPPRLEHLLAALRRARSDLVLRVSTRIPVVAPDRITKRIVGAISRARPAWLVVHVNHPRELTSEFRRAIDQFVDSGVPVVSQSVLLRGVNDSADTLEELFRGLVACRVKPYYLFHGDLAAGTSHFRTSIERGLELMRRLRTTLSGRAAPTYAVDLPDGAGKAVLTESTVSRRDEASYQVTRADGQESVFPREG